ncbi:MAG: hypothetical protein L3V56_06210 [Candidatus Magnetoovum sp. WYHC-5]|nr:hypothetical protein [Candidatus Magnetoovum sp. WYHC-5]
MQLKLTYDVLFYEGTDTRAEVHDTDLDFAGSEVSEAEKEGVVCVAVFRMAEAELKRLTEQLRIVAKKYWHSAPRALDAKFQYKLRWTDLSRPFFLFLVSL